MLLNRKRNDKIKKLSLAVVVIWMALIFILSSQPAEQSDKLSTGITKIYIKATQNIIPNTIIDTEKLHPVIRKNAHVFFYLVLGVSIINILRRSGVCGYKRAVVAFLICTIFAISDELHQLFVSGRAGQVEDVFIDTVGASVGISVYLIATQFVHFTSKLCKVSENMTK